LKIYAARAEALKKKERQGETQFTTKNGGAPKPPPLNANVFLFPGRFFFFSESHPIYDQTQGASVVFLTL